MKHADVTGISENNSAKDILYMEVVCIFFYKVPMELNEKKE